MAAMAYRSILTYYDNGAPAKQRLNSAIALARQFDAHLTVAAFSYEPGIPPYAYGESAGLVMAEFIEECKRAVHELAKQIDARLQAEGVRGEVKPIVCPAGLLSYELGRLAQFAELTVLGRPYGDGADETAADALTGVLFDGDAPALLCPGGTTAINTTNVVVAWNNSREALRAVRYAMPLLTRAGKVTILMVEPGAAGAALPGEALATMLDRHGAVVEVSDIPKTGAPIGALLGQRVLELGAGLLVMGAYGHTRFREYIMGGATRDLLERLPVPVLAAH
jgi:nucleotide-binding universal stress UspA family protein